MVRIGEEPCIISLESPCRELSNDRRFIHVTNKTAKYNVGWYRETSPLSSKEDRGFFIPALAWHRVKYRSGTAFAPPLAEKPAEFFISPYDLLGWSS